MRASRSSSPGAASATAFRNFRTDRVVAATPTENRYGKRRSVLAKEWQDEWDRIHPDWAAERERC